MSWLSQFLHNPIDYTVSNPLKTLGLLAAPIGAIAAPFLAPEIGAAVGLGGGAAAGAGALGAGEAAAGLGIGEAGAGGLLGAEAGGAGALGLAEGGGSLAGLLEGAGGPFSGLADSGMGGELGALGYGPTNNLTGLTDFAEAQASGYGGAATDAAEAQASGYGAPSSGITNTPGPAANAPPQQDFWSRLVGGAETSLTKNPLGIAAAGLGLGMNVLRGSQTSPEMKAMESQAGQLNKQQAQLMSYLQQGTLPPGLKSAVDSATQAAKANAISNAARNGMNTDPTQNTALAQQLASIDRNAIELIAKEGVALMNSGLQAAQISSQLYGMIEKLNREQSAQTGQAIASFAAALSGGPTIRLSGGPGVTIGA